MTHTNAAAQFGSLPELLRLLASQVRSRKQLARMRLVSRAFADVLAPVLFDQVRIVRSDALWVLHDLCNFEHVGHVKQLTVDGWDNHKGCNAALQDGLLARLPRLERFTWRQMPLAPDTLRVLHASCPRIKAIHVIFHKDMGERELGYGLVETTPEHLEARAQFGRPDLSLFSSLEELTLHNLCEELPWWQAHIAQVLRRNAHTLKRLALSLSAGTCYNYSADENEEPFHYFFKELCAAFGGVATDRQVIAIGPPTLSLLHLECLFLGTGIGVDDPTWLEALTDLDHLREVYVFNGGIYAHGAPVRLVYEGDAFDGCDVAFDAFRPARCPHLRWLTVHRYQFDVYAFLAQAAADNPAWVRRLAVSVNDMSRGFELATLLQTIAADDLDDEKQFLAAPVHLRMLEMDLQRDALELYVCKGDGEDLLPTADNVPSAQQVLDDLVAGDEGTLEGLTVHLEERRAANEYGEPGLGAGVEFVRLELLATNLALLTNLTQLAIQSYGAVFSKSYFPEVKLVDTAVFLAAAVPSLHYIRVCQLCWRIWREDNDGDGDEDKTNSVRLEILEDREITDVELFGHTIWEVELDP